MELFTGVYETLISKAIQQKLSSFSSDKYFIKKNGMDSAESPKMLAEYLAAISTFKRTSSIQVILSRSVLTKGEVWNMRYPIPGFILETAKAI